MTSGQAQPSEAKGTKRWRVGLLLALALFAALAAGAVEGRLGWLDAPVSRAVQSLRAPAWTRVMSGVSLLGHGGVLTLLVIAAVLWLRREGRRHLVGYLVVTAAGAGLSNLLLKLSFARPRPEVWSRLAAASGYSFPSGHAMASAAIYAALAIVLVASRPTLRVVAPVTAGAVVLAVGVSRVYLGVHYPSDVLAGWLLGVIWALLLRPSGGATRRVAQRVRTRS